jgi:hypothetical protein
MKQDEAPAGATAEASGDQIPGEGVPVVSRLRAVEVDEKRDRRVPDARKVAVEVAADAALTRRGKALTADQLDVLEAAAPFVGDSVRALDRVVRGVGSCSGEDPERFYPVYREHPARAEYLDEERVLARQLCDGCPVKAQCLALDYAQAAAYGNERRDGVQHLWGIRAGLGARDRRVLLPLWVDLVRRLDATDADQTTESAAVAASAGQAIEAARAAVAS